MSKTNYKKQPLSFQEQLNQLKKRELIIENDDKALHLLKHLSYYRLSGYWYTLLQEPKNKHLFKPKSSFEQVFNLYCFDRELRLLVLNQIEKIEIAIRSIISYECSQEWGTFWLSESNNFKSEYKYTRNIERILKEVKRSKEFFLDEYKRKYNELIPPSWISLEVCSFGSLSTTYSVLKSGKTKRNIAKNFGLNEKVFESWLHSIIYIRNICAHHSRLWNKHLAIKPILPNKTNHKWITSFILIDSRTNKQLNIKNRTYFALCMIKYLLETINPNNSFTKKSEDLFDRYPLVDKKAVGYTDNWKDEPLWR